MANHLVLRTFRAAVGNAGVQVFRPGDYVSTTDPDYSAIAAAAPLAALVSSYPSGLQAQAISQRLRAVPDDLVELQMDAEWINWC